MDRRFKVWLEADGKFVLGEGTYRLLCAVEEKKSLSEAARSLQISYRHAWRKVREIEKNVGKKIVERKRGGEKGGHSSLTEEGWRIVREYEQLKERVERAAKTI